MQGKRNQKFTSTKNRRLNKYKTKTTFLGINTDSSPTRKQSQCFLLQKQQRFFFPPTELTKVGFIYIHWICTSHKESASPAARLALRLATEGVYLVLFIKSHLLRQCVDLIGQQNVFYLEQCRS